MQLCTQFLKINTKNQKSRVLAFGDMISIQNFQFKYWKGMHGESHDQMYTIFL